MANPDYGYCVCPVCRYERAAVRIAVNNKSYISCDNCVSSVRTLSSIGDKAIRALMTSRAGGDLPPAVPPVPAVKGPDQTPAPKPRGGFSDALDALAGRGK